jgi:hypothetical protein
MLMVCFGLALHLTAPSDAPHLIANRAIARYEILEKQLADIVLRVVRPAHSSPSSSKGLSVKLQAGSKECPSPAKTVSRDPRSFAQKTRSEP